MNETEIQLPDSGWRFSDFEAWSVFQSEAIAQARKVQNQLRYQKARRIAAPKDQLLKHGVRKR